MSSLDKTFQELVDRLRQPEARNAARIHPFFYFVHHPGETLQVSRTSRIGSAPWPARA